VTTPPPDETTAARPVEAEPGSGAAAAIVADPVGGSSAPSAHDASEPGDWWESDLFHPIRRFEASTGRRWLPGISYPIALWFVWRVVHLAVSSFLGGDWQKVAFYYDGERYLQITTQGYAQPNVEMPNTAFFPGVSWLSWPIWKLTSSPQWTGHVVATVTAIAAFVCVWGVSKAWKDEAIARKAVWLLALFPSSLFLWSYYSEGLFIALGAGAVWADRKGHRWVAAACLMGISTTRSVGILIPAVIVLARIIRQRKLDKWCFIYAGAAVVGLVPVLFMIRYYTGNPFSFFQVQKDWGRGLSAPWTTVANGFDNLWPAPETIMVPALVARNFDLWSIPIVAFGVGWVGLARKEKFPMEAWMLGVALIALQLCSTSLASFNRFVLADWVIFPAYASFAHRLPPWWRRTFWVVVVIALSVTTYHMIGRVSVDRFVG
jgi:hypothetical protein